MKTLSRLYLTAFIVALLGIWVQPVAAQSEETLEQLLARLSRSPTISEVQEAAIRRAELDPRQSRTLIARVRSAGLLPRLEASFRRGLARDEDLDRTYQEMDELSLATDHDLDLDISVRWDLDRLIYDPEELRARREASFQAQRRQELLLAVTRMYYELLLLRAQEELASATESPDDRIPRLLRLRELRALLDGLTGGLLSRDRGSEMAR